MSGEIEIIPREGKYPGRTMLRYSDTKAIICIGVGADAEQAVRDEAAKKVREFAREREG